MIGNGSLKGMLRNGASLFLLFLAAVASAATPPLRSIRFEGDLPFSRKRANTFVESCLNKPYDEAAARDAAKKLRDACVRRYYPMAEVDFRLLAGRTAAEPQTLVFKVDRGPQGKLMEVRLTGNRALSAADLKPFMTVRPRLSVWDRWLARDILKIEDLKADQQAMQRLYLQAGYATAKVGDPKLEWIKSPAGFRLTWTVLNEGPSYSIGYIRLDAEQLPPPASLAAILEINAGEPFDRSRVDAATERFKAYCRDQGYAFASVKVKEEWVENKSRVDLLFLVRPGMKQRLRHTRVSGNKVTREHVVRREIPLKQGDYFDDGALQEAQGRLAILPLFSDVRLHYEGAADSPVFDLVADVEERKTGRFEAGVVYGEAEGIAFQLNVNEDNLSLRPPFSGDAYQGNVSLTAGSDIRRISTGLRNPRVLDSLWSLDGSLFGEDNKFISDYYSQRSYGGRLMASHPLGRHHVLTTGYDLSSFNNYDIDEALLQSMSVTNEDVFLTSWVVAWDMDYTDHLIRPTRGVRLGCSAALGSSALGGDTDLLQTSANAGLYINPFRSHVVNLRGGVESADPYGDTETVALSLRRFLGGHYDLRGFKYNTVSPLNDKGVPIGGQSAWWSTIEYQLPVGPRLDLAFYYDVGDVGLDAYQFSGEGPVSDWGIGVLIRADNFPVRFDVATPIETLEGDKENEVGKTHFSFSAGYRF